MRIQSQLETRRLRRRRAGLGGGLLNAEKMHHALGRLRTRSDHSGRPFSLLVFSFPADQWAAELELLAAVLDWHAPQSSRVGLLAAGKLALALPGATVADARTVAAELSEQAGERGGQLPPHELFVYPSATRRIIGQEVPESAARPLEPLFVVPLPAWKRAMDIVGSVLGLALLSPLFLLAALVVKLNSRGPVFFAQDRSGIGGERFRMYKIRTMYAGAELDQAALRALNERDGPVFKIRNDPRVTPVGRFLRRTCIDELPQLWNVLKGDMSLVGPRPLPCQETAALAPWQRRRLDVTPGLTCTWQATGGLHVSFDRWMRMDIRYAKTRGFWGDVKLLLRTLWRVMCMRASH